MRETDLSDEAYRVWYASMQDKYGGATPEDAWEEAKRRAEIQIAELKAQPMDNPLHPSRAAERRKAFCERARKSNPDLIVETDI